MKAKAKTVHLPLRIDEETDQRLNAALETLKSSKTLLMLLGRPSKSAIARLALHFGLRVIEHGGVFADVEAIVRDGMAGEDDHGDAVRPEG